MVALGLSGCGATSSEARIDAGETIPKCPNAPVCDGLAVRECRNGVVGDKIDDCAMEGACSQGRCMSPACAAADRVSTSFIGCVFYTAEPDNVASDADAPTSFLVSNPGVEPATVVLEVPAGDGTWMIRATQSVAGGGAARLSVAGRQIVTNGVSPADGLRLFSTRPVTVAQITSDDTDQHAQSSGGTMVLPTHALGLHHRVMTYKQYTTSATVSAAGASAGAGRLLIVGSVPKTTVNITLSRSAATAVTGIDAMDASAPFQFTVGDGDVYQAWTGANLQDLAGTEITSDQPIAVFSGNIVTAYGKTNEGVHSPDMAHEQMPPIADWSLKYVAASLPPQAGTCDTLLGQSGASVWRLLAAMDQTNVTFEVPTGTPPGAITMGAGETFDMIATGDFVVTATAPLLLTQGIDCEPSLSLGVPVDQLLDDLTFAVLPWFDQVAAVVRKAGKPITLDGVPIPESLFAAAGGGYEVARVSIPTCDASDRVCAHRLQGSFGLTLRGMDVLSSYALTMPTWVGCHDVDLTCPQ